ncbi:Ypt/Rab-GAP domain of gyp1p superfamily protein [Striga asiatica]|uniref:Ypt/Rab-GAP domain of gyp1p superfamily protein n=1 Tax=Striga asiatica TaxID=4170 RepID=A0A5A7NVJ3_STRAF|nr:Ypt/Rab-GAP domain of gyp1p superfamily protein [Striga asiatica]
MKNAIRCCISCILPCGALDVIRIVHANGRVEEISGTVSAAEIMKLHPKHVLKKPSSSPPPPSAAGGAGRRIVVVPPDAELQRGKIYFLMPAPPPPPPEKSRSRAPAKRRSGDFVGEGFDSEGSAAGPRRSVAAAFGEHF